MNSPKENIKIDLTSKIGNRDKWPSLQKTPDGKVVEEFLSIAHANRGLKISRRSLSCALSRAQKTAGGFIWEEVELPEEQKENAEQENLRDQDIHTL